MPSLHVVGLPALKDNYIWLIIADDSRQCMIVDPGDANVVLTALQQQQLQPVGILLTHHHLDHSGGITTLLTHHAMPVFGSALSKVEAVDQPLQDGDTLQPLPGLTLQAIAIPGHTHDHIAYYGDGRLFCGDTLFTAACGRVFEGTMAQMHHSLQRLAALPLDTLVYCGHEYTAANIPFALAVEPDNTALQQRAVDTVALREQGLPTVPSTLELELATNPFLRCHEPAVKTAAENYCGKKLLQPEDVFAVLRDWKNNWKG